MSSGYRDARFPGARNKSHTRVLLIGTASCALVGGLAWIYYSYWGRGKVQWRHKISDWPCIKGYRLLKYLDYGATCKVFAAIDETTGQEVALKVMYKPDLSYDQLNGIKSEVKAMEALNHANIVRLHKTIQTNDFYILVMDYAAGDDLFKCLVKEHEKHDQGLPEERAKCIAAQLISAIMYVHSQGIIHRDLKLENVLLATEAPDSVVKICDFGMAKVIQRAEGQPLVPELLVAHSRVGTDGYLSPDVNTGNYDFKVDYWSFGIMLFMLLCGYPPTKSPKDVSDPHAFNRQELRLELATEGWAHVSAEAKDFVEAVLFPDPAMAVYSHEADHPFFAGTDVDAAFGAARVTRRGVQLCLHPWLYRFDALD